MFFKDLGMKELTLTSKILGFQVTFFLNILLCNLISIQLAYEFYFLILTFMETSPWRTSISPNIADMSELFPEPTFPTTATSFPGVIDRLILRVQNIATLVHA